MKHLKWLRTFINLPANPSNPLPSQRELLERKTQGSGEIVPSKMALLLALTSLWLSLMQQSSWSWLHYRGAMDTLYCHLYSRAPGLGYITVEPWTLYTITSAAELLILASLVWSHGLYTVTYGAELLVLAELQWSHGLSTLSPLLQSSWSWLHYSGAIESLHCHLCCRAPCLGFITVEPWTLYTVTSAAELLVLASLQWSHGLSTLSPLLQSSWSWLHYSGAMDSLHCHLCCRATDLGRITVEP